MCGGFDERPAQRRGAGWPKTIAEGETAALLLPIAAGGVGEAVARHPTVIAEPIFGKGHDRP